MKFIKFLLLAVLVIPASPALAHHPLNGLPLQTLPHGLLSGVAHPLLGYDHLFFIVAAGALCVYAGVKWSGPLVLLVGVVTGVLFALGNLAVSSGELLVALSLVVFGGLGMLGRKLPTTWILGLLVFLGTLHGWMYGQTLVAQESVLPAVFAGYLIGLITVHYLIAVISGHLLFGSIKALGKSTSKSMLKPQLACALVAGMGVTIALELLLGN